MKIHKIMEHHVYPCIQLNYMTYVDTLLTETPGLTVVIPIISLQVVVKLIILDDTSPVH